MCLFYHSWLETQRHFTPPLMITNYEGKGGDETLLKILQGFTTIEMHCTKCNDIKTIVLIGKCMNVS